LKTSVVSSTSPTFILALEEIREKLKKEPDFLILAVSDKYPEEYVIPSVERTFKTENFIAFNALDAFKDSSLVQGVTACALYFINSGDFSLKEIQDYEDRKSLKDIISFINEKKNWIHLFIGSTNESVDSFVNYLSEGLKYRPINNVIGGLASGEKPKVFTKNGIIDRGGIFLSLKNFSFQIGIALGFKPYGVTYTITKAKNRKIYEIDEKPAPLLFKKLLKGIEEREKILWFIPLYILDDKEGYVATIRTPAKLTDEYLEVHGEVKEGTRFKLSFAFPEDLLEESKRVAKEVKEKIGSIVDLIINFSCTARQFLLDDKSEKEPEIYSSVLNSHLFGFFTCGEIGPDRGLKKVKLYNETSLIVALREK